VTAGTAAVSAGAGVSVVSVVAGGASEVAAAGSSVAVAGSVTVASAGVVSFLLRLLMRLLSFAFRLEKAFGAIMSKLTLMR